MIGAKADATDDRHAVAIREHIAIRDIADADHDRRHSLTRPRIRFLLENKAGKQTMFMLRKPLADLPQIDCLGGIGSRIGSHRVPSGIHHR